MKKLVLMATAIVAVSFASCGNKAANNTTEAEYTGSLVSSSITVPLTVTFCAHKHVPNKHIMKINRHLFFLMVFIYIRLLFL